MPSLGLGNAFKKAVTSAASAAKDLAIQAKDEINFAPKCLRDYSVGRQVATAGPEGLWKVFAADVKKKGPQRPTVASVWILDRKQLSDANKGAKLWEAFLERQRRNSVAMLKMKHPGIVKILEPLEETRNQLVMVTEAIFGSVDSVIHHFEGLPNTPKEVAETKLSELEIKHGILQVADALHFLHNDANVAHCGVNTKSVVITAEGAWKLACFDFSVQINVTGEVSSPKFDYSKQSVSMLDLASRPNLDYLAPELAGGVNDNTTMNPSPACDMFSLGLVAHEALTGRKLVDCKNEVVYFKSKVVSLARESFPGVPPRFEGTLRAMLSLNRDGRPSAADVPKSPYFQEDMGVRALVFLDGFVQRDNMQKASFLKDLEGMWSQFDSRIIRYKVLPHILHELRNEALAVLLFPFVFRAIGQQSKEEFMTYTLPGLLPILKDVKGDALILVLKHCDDVIKHLSRELVGSVMLPLVGRSLAIGDPKVQEVALKSVHGISEHLDYAPIKDKVLPHVHVLALTTTSAKVRINSLVLMGALVERMDKDEAEKMLNTMMQVTSVDRTPGTLMCVLGVGDGISKHWGEEMTAQKVIPLLSPLLVSKSLSHGQFSTYITLIREMLTRIEKKTGSLLMGKEPLEAANGRSDSSASATAKASKPSEQLTWSSPAATPAPSTIGATSNSSSWTSNPNPTPPTSSNSIGKASNPFDGLDALYPTPSATSAATEPAVAAVSLSGQVDAGLGGVPEDMFRDPSWKDTPVPSLSPPGPLNTATGQNSLGSSGSSQLGQGLSNLGMSPIASPSTATRPLSQFPIPSPSSTAGMPGSGIGMPGIGNPQAGVGISNPQAGVGVFLGGQPGGQLGLGPMGSHKPGMRVGNVDMRTSSMRGGAGAGNLGIGTGALASGQGGMGVGNVGIGTGVSNIGTGMGALPSGQGGMGVGNLGIGTGPLASGQRGMGVGNLGIGAGPLASGQGGMGGLGQFGGAGLQSMPQAPGGSFGGPGGKGQGPMSQGGAGQQGGDPFLDLLK